ncbi:MAG: DNRLRE domain-containing protein [candidate division Zixibacteria bacterium]|nr:DNRLRE domain-containing protein [candidate division Zixibacteria bacterium]
MLSRPTNLTVLTMLTAAVVLAGCSKDNPTDGGQSSVNIDTLLVAEDAYIHSDVPDGHYGTSTELSVVTVVYVGGLTVEYRAFVKLPPLPASLDLSRLAWADLELSYTGTDSSRQIVVKAYPVADDWHEDSITWNNAPLFDSALFDSARVSNYKLSINVAPIYRLGDPNKGIMLTTIDGTEQVFHSSETTDSNLAPIIKIGYTPE